MKNKKVLKGKKKKKKKKYGEKLKSWFDFAQPVKTLFLFFIFFFPFSPLS